MELWDFNASVLWVLAVNGVWIKVCPASLNALSKEPPGLDPCQVQEEPIPGRTVPCQASQAELRLPNWMVVQLSLRSSSQFPTPSPLTPSCGQDFPA